jgi:hypothetical protein
LVNRPVRRRLETVAAASHPRDLSGDKAPLSVALSSKGKQKKDNSDNDERGRRVKPGRGNLGAEVKVHFPSACPADEKEQEPGVNGY